MEITIATEILIKTVNDLTLSLGLRDKSNVIDLAEINIDLALRQGFLYFRAERWLSSPGLELDWSFLSHLFNVPLDKIQLKSLTNFSQNGACCKMEFMYQDFIKVSHLQQPISNPAVDFPKTIFYRKLKV